MLKNKKGITLVAIIVTIIILIILSTITIVFLLGEEGMLKKTNEAKLASRVASIEDQILLWREQNRIIDMTEGNLISRAKFMDDLKEKKLYNEEDDYLDEKLGTLNIGKRVDEYGISYYKSLILPDPNEMKLPEKHMVLVVETTKPNEELIFEAIMCTGIKIIWGDNTDNTVINGDPYLRHIYKNPGRYEVRIVGSSFGGGGFGIPYTDNPDFGIIGVKKSIITGIKQWGENQFLILGYLGGNIKELPIEHTKKSFSNIMSFRRTFMNCKDLTFIPDNLFTNCINVQYFTEVFEGCENLENIPANLFVDLKNCKGFERAFKNCINLKGTVYPIWEDENIKGDDCFLNCTKLNNYNEIPEIWK